MIRNFCGKVLSEGGALVPLIIPHKDTEGTGLMNPSLLIDDDKIYVNVRHTNYILYHNEGNQHFYSVYGPLVYMNPENDQHLKTNNFFCHMNEDLSISSYSKIDTKKFDNQLVYEAEFHGLEDGRLVKWEDRLFICGVRRDTEPTGIGRFELSEFINKGNSVEEINRYRIEPPKKGSFCEKNWMPVLDMPYHFVKWTNPLEIIKVSPSEGTSETVILHHDIYPGVGDIRGGSQVILVGDYRICIIHEVNLKNSLTGKKDAKYVHRFIIWDKGWNLVKMSEPFSFLNGEIEFSCGMGVFNKDILLTFGFQDNAAYLLKIPGKLFNEFIGVDFELPEKINTFSPVYYISSEKYPDRQKEIKKQIIELDIKKTIPVIITAGMDNSILAKGKYIHSLDTPTLYAATSHLRAIKKWVNEASDPYAIFVEDDVNLRTIKWWNFTWDEFIKNLPTDWDCIQLSCVRQDLSEVRLRKREWDDWSATAYLLKREYAIRLINQYYTNEIFNLELPDSEIQPLIENILYLLGNIYMIPLFTENIAFKSTSHKVVMKEEYKPNHLESATFINNWWEINGSITPLKDIML